MRAISQGIRGCVSLRLRTLSILASPWFPLRCRYLVRHSRNKIGAENRFSHKLNSDHTTYGVQQGQVPDTTPEQEEVTSASLVSDEHQLRSLLSRHRQPEVPVLPVIVFHVSHVLVEIPVEHVEAFIQHGVAGEIVAGGAGRVGLSWVQRIDRLVVMVTWARVM